VALKEADIVKAFDQARVELYCPPCRLEVSREGKAPRRRYPAPVSKGAVYVNPEAFSGSLNPEAHLLWALRHDLSHAHYCPYDVKTAYQLQKAAYRVTGSRSLAYFTLHLFCDLQTDGVYLRNRFHRLPYHVEEEFRKASPKGAGRLGYAVYKAMYPEIKSRHVPKEFATYAGLIAETIRSAKPWRVKVETIASILSTFKTRNPKLLKDSATWKYGGRLGGARLVVREDFSPNSATLVAQVLGGIKDREEARSFFEQWVKPRLTEGSFEKGKVRALVERATKPGAAMGAGGSREEKVSGLGREKPGEALEGKLKGESYELPTALGRKHGVKPLLLDKDALWKRFWYRARAAETLIQYLTESPRIKPTWKVLSYPDEWSVEDDIEALDLETSLDEGPIIPEVTTLKWHESLMGYGQGPVSGYVPSVVTVLDSSQSMSNAFDEASTAAYIAYLSALWAGGDAAAVSFSTNHLVADWSDQAEVKELVLATHFNALTIIPTPVLKELVKEAGGPCFIVVITDGGWQNIKEASPMLRSLGEDGHRVAVFHLYGWRYPEEVKTLEANPYLTLHRIDEPERDLKDMVLSEAMKTYERFML